jgi:hypothetical protein
MEPSKLLEKFAYRRRDKRNAAEFARIKNEKGQLEDEIGVIEDENPEFGFKCLHYSVTESAGQVEITVKRKRLDAGDCVGVRTQDLTAKSPKDYTGINMTLQFKPREDTAKLQIPIVDDEAWNPDLEFEVILYDITSLGKTQDRLAGGDTRCVVTILDEDFPGTIEFSNTEVEVSKKAKYIDVEI